MDYDVLIIQPVYNILIDGVFRGQFSYNRRSNKFAYSFVASIFDTDVNNVRLKLIGAELVKYHYNPFFGYLSIDDGLPF